MGLPPLEYIDCFLDSPNFREVIALYEKELESNAGYVKSLVKECQHMIKATEGWLVRVAICLHARLRTTDLIHVFLAAGRLYIFEVKPRSSNSL